MIIKGKETNWKYILIVAVLAFIVGGFTYWQYLEIQKEEFRGGEMNIPEKKEIGQKDCATADDCVIFGQTGECNYGCFNKDYQWNSAEEHFCLAPASCKCENGKCTESFWAKDLVALEREQGKIGCCDPARFDLNNDGVKELITFEGERGASGNGPIYVFQEVGGSWKKIGEFIGNRLSVGKDKTDDYYNIRTSWHLGAGSAVFCEYKWNKIKQLYSQEICESFEVGL